MRYWIILDQLKQDDICLFFYQSGCHWIILQRLVRRACGYAHDTAAMNG